MTTILNAVKNSSWPMEFEEMMFSREQNSTLRKICALKFHILKIITQ